MNRIKKLPYLIPHPERVKLGEWHLVLNDASQPLNETLPEWDAAMPIHAATTAEVDTEGVLADCGLAADAVLRLAAVWSSPGTGLRGCGSFVDLGEKSLGGPQTLELKVDGAKLADRIILEVALVLVSAGSSKERLAPKLPGSLLWRQGKSLLLEGETARFPMEVTNFAESSWLPENAAWFLDWKPDDFEQAVLGTVRLYINAGHERVKLAVSGRNESDHAIREVIRFEVARTLILTALADEEFVSNPDRYPDGTVGAAVSRLFRILFPTESLKSLQQSCQQYPNFFECRLQHNLRLFGEE
jgi:hypothetical protein